MPKTTNTNPRLVIATAELDDLIGLETMLAEIGYTVTTVEDGADAYRLVEALGPELVLAAFKPTGFNGKKIGQTRRVATAESLLVADVELDDGRRAVTRAGQPVELTLTEYSLLELLMRNANVVLERATIYERLWGAADLHHTSKALDVHIGALRRKLERHGDRIVQNVRGVGYVMWA